MEFFQPGEHSFIAIFHTHPNWGGNVATIHFQLIPRYHEDSSIFLACIFLPLFQETPHVAISTH